MRRRLSLFVITLGLLLSGFTFLSSFTPTSLAAHNPPRSQADCSSGQYFVPGGGSAFLQPHCESKLQAPRAASDCPKGYKYVADMSSPTGHRCQLVSSTGCTSSQYYVAPTPYTQGHCVNKKDQPRNASDCPKGYKYVAGTTMTHAQCVLVSAAACQSNQHLVAASAITHQPAHCVNNADDPRNQGDCPKGTQYVSASDSSTGKAMCQKGTSSTTTSSHETNPTCETGGDPLDWILCPVYNGVAGFSDWMFSNIVQPFLVTTPINTNPNACNHGQGDCTYQIWSQFRVYGDIFLVIALLVVVFGQSIGGGLIDAYTAKKVLPRLLAAAILINLSIYIVAAMVDITNILGGGIGTLITAPLGNAGAFHIHPNAIQAGSIIAFTAVGGAAGIAAGLLGLLSGISAITSFLAFVGLFVLMPAFFGILAAFITLVIRKAIILTLILVSPVAFALYCLPNTEKYFRKWWEFLLQTLAVYPIVIIFFAVADVLSVTIMNANGKDSVIAPVISFLMQFLPLLFIPYAFRLAGGAVGKLHEVLTSTHKRAQEGIKGNPNDPWSLRNMTRRKVGNSMLMGREKLISGAHKRQKAGGRYGLLARGAGLAMNDVRRSKLNRESAEMAEGLTGKGDDWRYRASFARQLNYRRDTGRKNADGSKIFEPAVGWFGTGAQDDGHGNLIQDAEGRHAGQSFSAEQVRQSRNFLASDPSHYQAGLTYELNSKAGDDDDVLRVLDAHDRNMEEMRVGEQEEPMWVGTVFAGQQKYKDLKHTRTRTVNGQKIYERNSRDHSREHAQTVNNYALSNMSERTIGALTDDYINARAYLTANDANATGEQRQAAQQTMAELANKKVKIRALRDADEAKEVISNVTSTANSLNSRMLDRGSYALEGETPVSGAQTGAPGKVQEAIDRLVKTAATNNTSRNRGRYGPEMGGGHGLGV